MRASTVNSRSAFRISRLPAIIPNSSRPTNDISGAEESDENVPFRPPDINSAIQLSCVLWKKSRRARLTGDA